MPATVTPLRGGTDDQGPESPEALLISAFIELGSFVPERYSLSEEDLACLHKLWRFCVQHQQQTGYAPDRALIKRKFPEFELTKNVDVNWAADQLQRAAWKRKALLGMSMSNQALRDEDYDAALEALQRIGRPHGTAKPGVNLFDLETVAPTEVKSSIEVPYAQLQRSTGGIGEGELWYLVARTSEGKSWLLAMYAAAAARGGYKVKYYSLEMKARAIARRVQRVLAARDPALQRGLESDVLAERQEALERLSQRITGSIEVLDPEQGRVTPDAIRDGMSDAELVIIDHVGLMATNGGGRAVDEWRSMAIISNQLKEECLASGVPILSAVQANRTADTNSKSPPKLSQISQADVGQDADVVIAMKRQSSSVMLHRTAKNREGPEVEWYSRFDPTRGRFEELDPDTALEMAANDEDRTN